MGVVKKNPEVLKYDHPNFNGGSLEVALNLDANVNSVVLVEGKRHDGTPGTIILAAGDDGRWHINLNNANGVFVQD